MTRDLERRKLKRFLLRLHWVLNHPSVRGQTLMAAVHGAPYTGPVLDRAEIHAMAGLPEELPDPEYPGSEFCVERLAENETMWAGGPVEMNIVFRGDRPECQAWMEAHPDGRHGVNHTGQLLDRGEESKWYALFDENVLMDE